MGQEKSFKNKLVVLRVERLGHVPPAMSATEILAEQGIPVVVVEYGRIREKNKYISDTFVRRRFASLFAALIPGGLRSLTINIAMVFRLAFRFFREGKPRLVMAEGLQEQCVALVLKWILHIPYAVHVHEIYAKKDLRGANRVFLWFEGMALRAADFLIFPERTRSEIYANRYWLKCPIFIVPNASRYRELGKGLPLREELRLPKKSFLLAYMGGLGPENALGEVIQAIIDLPNVYFLIWGWGNEGYVDSLKLFSIEQGIEERVKFLGQLNENKWKHLEGCDLSCCVYIPTLLRLKYSATASNKLMEAFACGVPVMTSAEPDYREIVEKYDVGIVAEQTNARAISAAIKSFTEDDLGRRRKAQNARALHEKIFHYEVQFTEVVKKCAEYGFTLSEKESATPISLPR